MTWNGNIEDLFSMYLNQIMSACCFGVIWSPQTENVL